ncbi:DUF805 domain-containing protein [Raphidiopsis sp. BLCC-F218]|jgi:uncharacterized membrane protein YhaH (DUF805 family)
MPLIEAYISAWKRSFEYGGRSTRGDFWWFTLASFIVSLIAGVISSKIQLVYAVAAIVPSIPLAVRRLRDIGKSWLWLFIGLIPIIGTIWLIVLYSQPSLI